MSKPMLDSSITTVKTQDIKQVVKGRYGKCAETGSRGSPCCAGKAIASLSFAAEHGLYSQEELSLVPELARSLSKGCGNPVGFANLQPGEVVVDFGCGAGIDVILAARKVGPSGKVFGVDFAPQMIERAKQAVADAGLSDAVKFVVADMGALDLPDGFADVVISNCVINLCPDKGAVYREAFRILKPGGRLAISDVIMTEEIDPQIQERFQSTWAGCVGGAIEEERYLEIIKKTGFGELEIVAHHPLPPGELEDMACCPCSEITPALEKEDIASAQGKVVSIKFRASKPRLG